MADPAPENPESEVMADVTESAPARPIAQESGSALGSILLKLWNLVMILSTSVLSFYLFILKDNSVLPFVALGIIGLCIPPVVGMFRTMARNKRLRIEHEQRMEQARQERIREARQRELERMQRERLLAEGEEALQNAMQEIDVMAHKVDRSQGGL